MYWDATLRLPTSVADLETEWRALAERAGSAFLLPEWYECVLCHYREALLPEPLVARGPGGELRALLPTVRLGSTLKLAGAGLGDHFEPLAREGCTRGAIAPAAAEAIDSGMRLILDNVDCDSGWCAAIADAAKRPARTVTLRDDVLPYIDLDGRSFEDYLAAKSRNFRSQVRRKRRKLEREHHLELRLCDDPDRLGDDMGTFFDLHDARWDPRGGTDGLDTARSRAFHQHLARLLLARGWLRLWLMELDGAPVAAWYGWSIGDRYAYYQGGFDPAWGDASVGFVLLAHTIEAAAEEGVGTYELLRGDESYKSRFETGRRRITTTAIVGAADPVRVGLELEAALRRNQDRLPERAREVGKRAYAALGGLMPASRRR